MKNSYYHLVKGKNNLIENYGWYYDFANKLYDFKNQEIHYKEIVEQGRKKDFKGVELALYKDVILPQDDKLVKALHNIFTDEKFKEKNEETKKKLIERFGEEWNEIKADVEQHKDNPFSEELVKKYVVMKELPEEEMRKKIKEMSNEENDALNEYALYLTDTEIYDKIYSEIKADEGKENDFEELLKQKYIFDAMELAFEKGLYNKYDENGEPILDEEDWKDLTHWQLRINVTPKDKFKNIVYICNSKIMYEYANCGIVSPFIEKELANGMFRKGNADKLVETAGGEFAMNEKGIIEELGSAPIDNIQVDMDEYEDMEYENEISSEGTLLN